MDRLRADFPELQVRGATTAVLALLSSPALFLLMHYLHDSTIAPAGALLKPPLPVLMPQSPLPILTP